MRRSAFHPVRLGYEALEDRALPSCWMSGVYDPPPYCVQAGHIDVEPYSKRGDIHQENGGQKIQPGPAHDRVMAGYGRRSNF